MFQRPIINISKNISKNALAFCLAKIIGSIRSSAYANAKFDRNNTSPVLNYIGRNRHNENRLGWAEVGHCSQCSYSVPGNLGTWQFGVRAFWPHCGIRCVSTCSDNCCGVFFLDEQSCRFSVSWKAINTLGKGSVLGEWNLLGWGVYFPLLTL